MKLSPNFVAPLLMMGMASVVPATAAAAERMPFVRIAELEIDPARLPDFHAAVRESIDTSVRVEPHVLALYAVADKARPSRITVFEIYTDAQAYDRHRETPHFKKFFESTKTMVLDRRLIDTTPIAMRSKP
jgi:quinol monooxygenase YgiN